MAQNDGVRLGTFMAQFPTRITGATVLTALAAVCAGFLLSACTKSNTVDGDAVVVAKINADEITLGRLKAAMSRAAPGDLAQVSPGAPEQAIDTLVRQFLAAEQARHMDLDRDPKVRMAIEDASREILAGAYFDRLAKQAGKPSAADIHDYYVSHPELFRERRLYSLKEIAIPESASTRTAVTDASRSGRSIDDIARQLRRRGIEFHVTSSIRAPESLPIDMLPRLADAKLGAMVAYNGDGVVYVAEVIGLLDAPLKEDAVRERIAKYLENQNAKALLAEEEKRLRTDARIEIGTDLKKLLNQPPPSPPSLAREISSPPKYASESTTMPFIQ